MDTRPVVLLDLDNTILDFNHAERVALGRAFAQLGLEMNDDIAALYHKINIRHWEMLEDGTPTSSSTRLPKAAYRPEQRGDSPLCQPFLYFT